MIMNRKIILSLLLGSFFCIQAAAGDTEPPTSTVDLKVWKNTSNVELLSDIVDNHVSILKKFDKFVHGQEWRRDAIQHFHDLSPDEETTYALNRAEERCTAWQEGAIAFRTLLESIKKFDKLDIGNQELHKLLNEKKERLQTLYSEDLRYKNRSETGLYNHYYLRDQHFFNEVKFLGKLGRFITELLKFSDLQTLVQQNSQGPMIGVGYFNSGADFVQRLQQAVNLINFSLADSGSLPQLRPRNIPLGPLFKNIPPCDFVPASANNVLEAYQQKAEHVTRKFATPLIEELVASLKRIKSQSTKKAQKQDIKEKFTKILTSSQLESTNFLARMIQEEKAYEIHKLAFNDVKELLNTLNVPYRDKDNKIIATNPVNYKDTLVIHTHGKTITEDGGIISSVIGFVQRITDIKQ